IWYMNGVTLTQVVPTVPASVLPTTWKIVGIGDYGKGDPGEPNGQADILWRSDAGDLLVWYMNGAARSGYAYITGTPPPLSPIPPLTWRPSGRYIIPFGVLGAPQFSPA